MYWANYIIIEFSLVYTKNVSLFTICLHGCKSLLIINSIILKIFFQF